MNQYIKKPPFKLETVKSVQQSILVNDWAVPIDLTDANLHVPIHPQSRKYLHFMFDNQVLQFTALPFGKSMDFHQTDGCNSSSFASTCHLTISVPGRLAYKRSNSKQTRISHNILPSNSSKSKIHSKSKVRFDTSSAIHLYRVGISATTQHSQSTSRLHRIPTSDNQIISNSDSSFSTNFPFSFGQTQCSSRLHSPRQTSFTTALNVSLICLETSHYSSQSSSSDQQYDSISFEMVAGHQSTRSGNVHSSSRSRCIPFYGCQSLWMWSSCRADETILSWSLDGRPIPAPYQYS